MSSTARLPEIQKIRPDLKTHEEIYRFSIEQVKAKIIWSFSISDFIIVNFDTAWKRQNKIQKSDENLIDKLKIEQTKQKFKSFRKLKIKNFLFENVFLYLYCCWWTYVDNTYF